MARKRKGPTGGRACVQPGSEQTALSKNGRKSQGNNLAGRDPAEVFGWPRVVIERTHNRIFVLMKNKPWGWSDVDRECLTDVGASRYAEKLRERLQVEQKRDEARKARRLAAKIRERLDRMEARNG